MIKDDEQKSAISLIRQIIIDELDIIDDRVLIYNQKYNIPKDDGIFITLSMLGSKCFGNRNVQAEDTEGNPIERQEVNIQEMIQIDIMSKSTAALFRRWEVIAALSSNHSQQVQEQNSFRIAPIPNGLTDLSHIEGASRNYRFAITIVTLAWYSKNKKIDFYDDFKLRVLTEESDTGEIDQPQPDPEE